MVCMNEYFIWYLYLIPNGYDTMSLYKAQFKELQKKDTPKNY